MTIKDVRFKDFQFKICLPLGIFFGNSKIEYLQLCLFFLIIINLKLVLIELLSLTNLIKAQTLYIYKLLQIVIVCIKEKFIFVII